MRNLIIAAILLTLVSCSKTTRAPWELAPGIYVLDKHKPVKSVRQLAKLLGGKEAYIDRWATWCSPCLDEFRFKDSLNKFLRANDILPVYMNSDASIGEDTLFRFISNHDLKGYHLRLNNALKSDLTDRDIFVPLIPQYMIMNSEGIIVENRALRPSEGNLLYAQILNLLKTTDPND